MSFSRNRSNILHIITRSYRTLISHRIALDKYENLEIMSSRWPSQRLPRIGRPGTRTANRTLQGLNKLMTWKRREFCLRLPDEGQCFITCVSRKNIGEERGGKIGLRLDHTDYSNAQNEVDDLYKLLLADLLTLSLRI